MACRGIHLDPPREWGLALLAFRTEPYDRSPAPEELWRFGEWLEDEIRYRFLSTRFRAIKSNQLRLEAKDHRLIGSLIGLSVSSLDRGGSGDRRSGEGVMKTRKVEKKLVSRLQPRPHSAKTWSKDSAGHMGRRSGELVSRPRHIWLLCCLKTVNPLASPRTPRNLLPFQSHLRSNPTPTNGAASLGE